VWRQAVGTSGAAAIGRALEAGGGAWLAALDLWANDITPPGLAALVPALTAEHCSLGALDFGGESARQSVAWLPHLAGGHIRCVHAQG
jgi:hypothetical protein